MKAFLRKIGIQRHEVPAVFNAWNVGKNHILLELPKIGFIMILKEYLSLNSHVFLFLERD